MMQRHGAEMDIARCARGQRCACIGYGNCARYWHGYDAEVCPCDSAVQKAGALGILMACNLDVE
jgi:hypothetical protein